VFLFTSFTQTIFFLKGNDMILIGILQISPRRYVPEKKQVKIILPLWSVTVLIPTFRVSVSDVTPLACSIIFFLMFGCIKKGVGIFGRMLSDYNIINANYYYEHGNTVDSGGQRSVAESLH
jgi:hypothetical protein